MKGTVTVAGTILIAMLLGSPLAAFAEQAGGAGDAALARALNEAPLPLERGLAASARQGRPISAKYELEDHKIQLSVYTANANNFAEVIVNHTTGAIGKVVPIQGGGDLAAARTQSAAMAHAKVSLEAATARAVKFHDGYRAVSVIPSLKDGHPVLEVILTNGNDWQTVHEKLD